MLDVVQVQRAASLNGEHAPQISQVANQSRVEGHGSEDLEQGREWQLSHGALGNIGPEVSLLGLRDPGVFFKGVVAEEVPEDGPYTTGDPGDVEGPLPAEAGGDKPVDRGTEEDAGRSACNKTNKSNIEDYLLPICQLTTPDDMNY